ncbi:hypothetical protein BGZ95_010363 [Linnemannia exigua]|uniref:PPPDE domain-containing protein n=1 Tax=Linnemannia exigua TaxID=604196 RepID=A0AAD4H511_9FUNG|nr:hypothetical protein BGZ95_010363 [Linnemannia exigua]
MTADLRATMLFRIAELIESSTKDTAEAQFSVIYGRLREFKMLPGRGDTKSNRGFKHWKVLIEIGFDKFTVEFLENSLISQQGVVKILPYDPQTEEETSYALGSMTISTHRLYREILEMYFSWKDYSLTDRNCQHFVKNFLERFWSEMSSKSDHAKGIYYRDTDRATLKARIASFFSRHGSRSRS